MKKGSINLADTQTVPKEEAFAVDGSKVTLILKSTNLGASTLNFSFYGKGDNDDADIDWGKIQYSDADYEGTLTSGVSLVETFEVDNALKFKFEFDSGTTGTVEYEIFE